MNITEMLKQTMQTAENGDDDNHLRSNSVDGHWHESDQFHNENSHLIADYADCRASQLSE